MNYCHFHSPLPKYLHNNTNCPARPGPSEKSLVIPSLPSTDFFLAEGDFLGGHCSLEIVHGLSKHLSLKISQSAGPSTGIVARPRYVILPCSLFNPIVNKLLITASPAELTISEMDFPLSIFC